MKSKHLFVTEKKSESLILVHFRGIILPFTPDEFKNFKASLDALDEWSN